MQLETLFLVCKKVILIAVLSYNKKAKQEK